MSLYLCPVCRKLHDISKLKLSAHAPDFWDPEEHEDNDQCALTTEQCYINNRVFFIHGNLDIPIQESQKVFTWSVWTTLSRNDFTHISKRWDDNDRFNIGPNFGWLSTALPGYPDTVNLKCMVRHQRPGIRPSIEIEKDQDHPLEKHFREGIPVDELMTILHPFFKEE